VKEVSLILRNNILVSQDEFRILQQYSYTGNIWVVKQKYEIENTIIRYKAVEYIFDPEALTIFYIVSRNILATWETKLTKNFGPYEEFKIQDSIFIEAYSKTI